MTKYEALVDELQDLAHEISSAVDDWFTIDDLQHWKLQMTSLSDELTDCLIRKDIYIRSRQSFDPFYHAGDDENLWKIDFGAMTQKEFDSLLTKIRQEGRK